MKRVIGIRNHVDFKRCPNCGKMVPEWSYCSCGTKVTRKKEIFRFQ